MNNPLILKISKGIFLFLFQKGGIKMAMKNGGQIKFGLNF